MAEFNWHDQEDAWHALNRLKKAWVKFQKDGSTLPCERCAKPIVFTKVAPDQTSAACPCGSSDRERCEDLGNP